MRFKRLVLAVLPALAVLLIAAWSSASEQETALAYKSYASGDFFFPPYPSESDRMGMGVRPPLSSYVYSPALKVGWYVDWGSSSTPYHPDGAEYARTISFKVNTNNCSTSKIPASTRSQVQESITGTALINNLRANPGALWLIGNEPDSIYNCSPIMPNLYAELYHEFYTFIKAHDPTARVAIGAIVQPSPLRLEYLDKVLNRYEQLYGERLPTDVWNIHLYAFQERAGFSGAGVPPDASSSVGWTYNWAQMVDLGILAQNLRAMRQWMAERGERDKPLIITEFGQLVPDDGSYVMDGLRFTRQVSHDYLVGCFTHFMTATDELIGYPADGNRLVQLWAWYSLYDSYYGGDLVFYGVSGYPDGSLTPAGGAMAQLSAQNWTLYADVYPAPLATPSMPLWGAAPFTASLAVQVDNHGTRSEPAVPARLSQRDYASGQLYASRAVTAGQVLTRYGGTQPQINASWVLTPGLMYTLTFDLDPSQTISHARRTVQHLDYRIGWMPDLAIASLAASVPSTFLLGAPSTATITITLSNEGNWPASPGLVESSVTYAAGTLYLSQTIPSPALDPGASARLTSTLLITTPGVYTIQVSAPMDAKSDQNLGNNAAHITLFAARARVYLPALLMNYP